MTTDELRALIEVECTSSLWGQPRRITPRLVEKIIGDGAKLIWFAPMMSRPNYYVVRIDSRDCLDNHHVPEGHREPAEWVEDVIQAIEAEYGNADDPDATDADREFPAFHDGGESWGEEDINDYCAAVAQ